MKTKLSKIWSLAQISQNDLKRFSREIVFAKFFSDVGITICQNAVRFDDTFET